MLTLPTTFDSRRKPGPWARIDWSHPLSKGIVGCWLMNEGGGTKVYDISGKGNHGTLTNGANWTVGQTGSATNYDGTDDYISVPSSSSLSPTSAITISGFIKSTNGSNRYIITKYDDSFYVGIGVPGTTTNKLAFFLNGVSAAWLQGVTDFNDNIWKHFVCTWDGSNKIIYVNGVIENSVTKSGTILTGSSTVRIGWRNPSDILEGNPFVGNMEFIVIHNRALSAAEVRQLYGQPFCFISQHSQWLIGGTSEAAAGHPAVKRMGGVQHAHRLHGPQHSGVW